MSKSYEKLYRYDEKHGVFNEICKFYGIKRIYQKTNTTGNNQSNRATPLIKKLKTAQKKLNIPF